MLKINSNKYIQSNITFNGSKELNIKSNKIVIDEDLDEFVSSVIKKERDEVGDIYYYEREPIIKKIKKYNKDFQDSLKIFILNDKLHIIKAGDKFGTFIDIIKKLK